MVQRRQSFHYLPRLQAHCDDLAEEADDVFGVVGAVGVVGDAAAFVGAHLVLVNHPFEGGTVAETVLIRLGQDAVQREEVVGGERGLVLGEAHHLANGLWQSPHTESGLNVQASGSHGKK